MQKSDFTSNYTGLFGRGNYLHRELLALIEHAEMHPQTAGQLLQQFVADTNLVSQRLTDAQARVNMSGPNGGPKPVPEEPEEPEEP